jgi:hypothetical protein
MDDTPSNYNIANQRLESNRMRGGARGITNGQHIEEEDGSIMSGDYGLEKRRRKKGKKTRRKKIV